MDFKTKTNIELKAMAFDILVQIETFSKNVQNLQQNVQAIHQEIVKRETTQKDTPVTAATSDSNPA